MRVALTLIFTLFISSIFSINAGDKSSAKSDKIYTMAWEEVGCLTSSIVQKCKKQPIEWKGILIVSRGGIVPGGILAEKLGIKNIRIICLESYNKKIRGTIKEIHIPNDITENGKGWLVVDDLADSGATFKYIQGLFPSAFYVALVAKPAGQKFINFFARKFTQDTWVVFPWEI